MLQSESIGEQTAIANEQAPWWKSVGLFVILAYGIAWILWLPLILGASGARILHYRASLPVFASLGTLGPMLASFLAVRWETGKWQMPGRLLPPRDAGRYLALLLAPALMIVGFIVLPFWICVVPGDRHLSWTFLAPLLAVWPNILGGPLEEEFGWRGYLLPRLTARLGPALATVVVGLIWACWHLPLFFVGAWAGEPFWAFLLFLMGCAVLLSLAYFATGRSILGPIVGHYVFNTCSTMLVTALHGAKLRHGRNLDYAVLGSFLVIAVLVIVVTRGRLGDARFADR